MLIRMRLEKVEVQGVEARARARGSVCRGIAEAAWPAANQSRPSALSLLLVL